MSKKLLKQFAGRFRLMSYEFVSSDGKVLFPFGESPIGTFINDGKGSYSAQIMRRDRPKPAGSPTCDELKAIFIGYLAYFGTMEVNEKEGIIINHVEGCLNPEWVGTDQIRYYEFKENHLTLKTPAMKMGKSEVTGTLKWERIE